MVLQQGARGPPHFALCADFGVGDGDGGFFGVGGEGEGGEGGEGEGEGAEGAGNNTSDTIHQPVKGVGGN